MKKLTRFLILGILFGFGGSVFAEDVVYLKDGSIIHGTITEEVPGVSLKIETKDGNVFVYKIKAVEKITHSTPAPAADEDQPTPVAPAPVNAVKLDPNAHFSKGILYLSLGAWNPYVVNQINDAIPVASDQYSPVMGQFGFGLGWLTNGLGLKWNVTGSYQALDEGSIPTYIGIYGSEVELDIAADMIKSSQDVTSIYLPLIFGVWDVDWNINGLDYTNYATDFGTGIGLRGFDPGGFYWDFQALYRWSARGKPLEYNSDPSTVSVIDGKTLDADVTGFGLDASLGFVL
jgi:hypothetical protein